MDPIHQEEQQYLAAMQLHTGLFRLMQLGRIRRALIRWIARVRVRMLTVAGNSVLYAPGGFGDPFKRRRL